MEDKRKLSVLNGFWILGTGMVTILWFFLPIFVKIHYESGYDEINNLFAFPIREFFTGYEGLVTPGYQNFQVFFVIGLLAMTLITMILSAFQLTHETPVSVSTKFAVALQTGISFFLLSSFSIWGWILEIILVANLAQILYIERKIEISGKKRLVTAIIIALLSIALPLAMIVSFWVSSAR